MILKYINQNYASFKTKWKSKLEILFLCDIFFSLKKTVYYLIQDDLLFLN